MSRVRGYCFTVHVPGIGWAGLDAGQSYCRDIFASAQYGVCQVEECPTTKKIHVQGFVYYKNGKSLATMKKLHSTAHFEAMRGTPKQASDYCKKEDSRKSEGFYEFGELPSQGLLFSHETLSDEESSEGWSYRMELGF